MKSPCYECDNRKIGCHSECADYAEWKFYRVTTLEYINKHKDIELGYKYDSIRRMAARRERRRRRG